ncbi:MAG: LytTR family DNA-binding domain-containing protein [Acidobacteriota bacterium]
MPANTKLRVVIADDERPARSYLVALLRGLDDVDLVGEAVTGPEAVELIERERPDLALLDLQMPELDGLGVVRVIRKDRMPLVAFVTAYDEYAVSAFEVHAIDYLLKPVERGRLRETINRAQERLEEADSRDAAATRLQSAAREYEAATRSPYLERLPIRRREEIFILPVREIASIIAEGELLHVTTGANEKHTLSYRLKDLEARLDPAIFVRLARGTLANIEMISRISPMPGGTYVVTLSNQQRLNVSRLQSRVLRDQLLRL